MRVLFASTRGAGHFNPLVPFIEACRRRGHDVLVAGPAALRPAVERTRYSFWECADPAEEELRPVWERVPAVSPDAASVLVVREIFARPNARAILPRLREACEQWRPDLVVRDPSEYGSAVAAELAGVQHQRVATGLAAVEEQGLRIAAATVDELGRSVGLPPDPDGERIRRSPYLSLFPASLEAPDEPSSPDVRRFRDPGVDATPNPFPDWWPDRSEPLVYVTFGSVTASLPMAAGVYRAALDAVTSLPARVLLTVGRDGDPASFGALPPHVRVARWVPNADVVAEAAVVVGHGGSGTTLGALAAGVPQVVVPLFADQPANAARVAAVGAGLVAPPDPDAIRAGLERVLSDGSFRAAAVAVAAELRAAPPVDEAFDPA